MFGRGRDRGGYSPEEQAILRDIDKEYGADDATAQVDHVSFQSRSSGKGRSERLARDIELVGSNGSYVQVKDTHHANGRLDEIARETFGDSVPDEDQREELLRRLRGY